MPTTLVNGCHLSYEITGSGQPVIFLPGGRAGIDNLRPMVNVLSPHYRMVTYDRRNCGTSDIVIGGEAAEHEIWADELAQLIEQMDLAPAYLGGWSSGCRVALLTTIRRPELVKGLLLGWATGGHFAAERLAENYYGQYIEAARQGGMAAVTETEFFAARIAQNPSNRERLLAMDVQEFIGVMRRWRTFFTQGADQPVLGATAEQLASIRVPTMIVAGDDDVHALSISQNLHRLLPNSELHDPVILREEWDTLSAGLERDGVRAERAGPIFLEFLSRVETKQPVAGS